MQKQNRLKIVGNIFLLIFSLSLVISILRISVYFLLHKGPLPWYIITLFTLTILCFILAALGLLALSALRLILLLGLFKASNRKEVRKESEEQSNEYRQQIKILHDILVARVRTLSDAANRQPEDR